LKLGLDNRRSTAAKKLDRFGGIPLVAVLALIKRTLGFFGHRRLQPKLQLRSQPQRQTQPQSQQQPHPANEPILVIKLSALGDAVVMLPALHRLKRAFPDHPLVFLGGASNELFVNELVEAGFISRFEKFSFNIIKKLRRERFMTVIDFDQWVRATAVITALMKTSLSCGFRSESQHRHFAYNRVVDFSTDLHTAENFWNLARSAIQIIDQHAEEAKFSADRDAVKSWWVSRFMRATTSSVRPVWPAYFSDLEKSALIESRYVVVHPGCGEHGGFREWPLDRWSALIASVKAAQPNLEVFVTGHGDYEKKMAETLEKAGARSLANLLNFKQLMAVLQNARRIYSGNTGIMHLGSLLNENMVVINGPTNPILWGPIWGGVVVRSPLACAPCLTWGNDYRCADPVCVKVITPNQVLGATSAEAAPKIF
jgi:heptosyltransferase III